MGKFKIAAAQVGSVRGDITRNLRTHAEAIEVAAEQGVAVLIFPELSLTGYEPDLAAELAFEDSDRRMEALGESAKHHQMTVVIGAPLITAGSKPAIGAIVFVAGFSNQAGRHAHEGIFQRPLSETIFSYLVALLVATMLLWLFQRGIEPWTDVVTRVVVLGLPAAVGGAAGRLAT